MSWWENLTKDRIYYKFITNFTKEEQQKMLIVSNNERCMRNSGMYDRDYDKKQTENSQITSNIKKTLSNEAKDFINYNHWRTWYPAYHKKEIK